MIRKIALLVALCTLVACGEDVGPREIGQTDPDANNQNNTNNVNNAVELALACEDSASPVGLEGSVFADVMDRANTSYDLPPVEDRAPISDVEVRLRDDLGGEWSVQTCPDGSFRFGELDPQRVYIVDAVTEGFVTSTNDAIRAFDAASEGAIDLLVFGDSIPSFGGTPWFPNVMRDSLALHAEVEMNNVSVPGSRSLDWLPGEPYFDTALEPELADADIIVFSLGGNDLQEFAFELQSAEDPVSRIGELQPLVDEIKANLRTILAELRTKAPGADIVWILYPNYATSTEWKALLGEFADAGERIVGNLLRDIREDMAEEQDLIIVDMLGATTETDLDEILADPLHLNTQGHAFYAAEILETLGFIDASKTPRRYDFAIAP